VDGVTCMFSLYSSLMVETS